MPPAESSKSRTTPTRSAHWRDADVDARRAMIVEAAIGLLHEDGLEAVTIRRVASQLKLGAMTLYTYVDGQDDLRRAMILRGFQRLKETCEAHSTLEQSDGWRGGARAYVQFAVENPNLYKLMFDVPMPGDYDDLLHGELEPLFDRVRQNYAERGMTGVRLERETRRAAGRYWIALHGLAALAIAGRLRILEGDIDQLLEDLLEQVAPF